MEQGQISSITINFARRKISFCQGQCESPISEKIFENGNPFPTPFESELYIGKLHQSVHKYAPRRLRNIDGFDNIVNFIEINDERENLWNANLRR